MLQFHFDTFAHLCKQENNPLLQYVQVVAGCTWITWNLNTYFTNWTQKCFLKSFTELPWQGSRVFLLLFPLHSSASPRLSSSQLKVRGHQVFGSILFGDVRGQRYACPAGQHHTHTHISNMTGQSVFLGELIVFRWGNLRRGSGREDRSKRTEGEEEESRGL